MLFESYCYYEARGDKVFGGLAKHLWSMFYNKSHNGGPDALAKALDFNLCLLLISFPSPYFPMKE